MSTLEDFENAPIGATASSTTTNGRYIRSSSDRWLLFSGSGAWSADESDLELAWELAHPVKEGQVIPAGAWVVARGDGFTVGRNDYFDVTANDWDAENRRTLDPLPEPLPDWLDAPAVLANEPGTGKRGVFIPTDPDTGEHWAVVFSALSYPWQELTDVTPLYPKGQEA